MKKTIVHLSSRYSFHGSFVSAKRFFNFFKKNKEFINIYLTGRIDEKFKGDVKRITFLHNLFSYKLFYYLDNLMNHIFHKKKSNTYWSNSRISYFNINKINEINNADVIILYWVNDGFLSLKNIEDILKLGKPIIWRLSDMWPFTGGCHYSFNCKQFMSNCKSCPQLSDKYINNLSNSNFNIKKKWKLNNLSIIAPSTYLEKKVKQSYLFKNVRLKKILNSVNVNYFSPIKKKNKKLKILVGPFNHNDKERKGYDNFIKLIDHVNKKKLDVHFEIFGNYIHNDNPNIVVNNGFLNKNELRKLYAKSDIYLFLSKSDNSPNTVAESLSCGTPIVTFKNNGTEDYCINNYNSIVISKFDEIKICNIIEKILNKKIDINNISKNARIFAKEHFSDTAIEKNINNFVNDIIKKYGNK
jgi:glycosyltransferase involved in cell wall biosynthesis